MAGEYPPRPVQVTTAAGAALIGQQTAAASLPVVLASDYSPQRWSVASITTQATTTVKSGAGVLGKLVIPTPVALATVKVYDNTAASGTVLVDTITFPATLVSDGPIVLDLGFAFSTGLTVITAGATMAVDVGYV